MPVCQGCGGSYSGEFKFCPYCGRAKPESDSLKIEVSVSSKDRWETCKTGIVVVERNGILRDVKPGKLKWVANAIGPNGKYITAESPIFEATSTYDVQSLKLLSKANKERRIIIRRLFDDLFNKLLKDGWDYIQDDEDSYLGINYQQFRRRAR